MYIPNKLFVAGDAEATFANIVGHQLLFRLGVVSDLAAALVLVILTLAFYRMFAELDRNLAVLVVLFGGVMPGVLYFIGAGMDLGVLPMVRGTDFLSAFSPPQQHGLAMLLLKLHSAQITAAETLWGIWLIPLGTLVYRSGSVPRLLGAWLALGGGAYLAVSFTGVLAPQFQGRVFDISQPFLFSELALTLWLVVKGSKE